MHNKIARITIMSFPLTPGGVSNSSLMIEDHALAGIVNIMIASGQNPQKHR